MRNRKGHDDSEKDSPDEEIRAKEAAFFDNCPEFNPAPCETKLPSLIQKLEDLQWRVYEKYLPGLERDVSAETYLACWCFLSHM